MIDRTKNKRVPYETSVDEPTRRYVAGFLFRQRSHALKQVLLVRKSHPKWQEGLMNAVGGAIELGESAMEAMMREFKEEANYLTNSWEFFAYEAGPGYEVYFFRHTLKDDWEISNAYTAPAENDNGESLEWVDSSGPKYPVVGNLNWLLPLALDPRPVNCVMRTTGDIRKLKTW